MVGTGSISRNIAIHARLKSDSLITPAGIGVGVEMVGTGSISRNIAIHARLKSDSLIPPAGSGDGN